MELAISDQVRWNVPVLMEQGIPVAFGTDGARSCVIGDAMHCGFLLAASAGVRIPPDKLLRMQTSEAARSVAMSDRLGSLEPGKRADLVIRRADTPELHPGINPVHQVALLGRTGTVDTVIVNGEMVLRSGRSCRVDEGRIAEESRRSVRERMQRLGLA